MKLLIASLITFITFTTHAQSTVFSAAHEHHAKHNMLLQGSSEIFAYHIVYKVPHNYQVVLTLNLTSSVKEAYLEAKKDYPGDTFILLLDSMDISKISESARIAGTLLRKNSKGEKTTIEQSVMLERKDYEVLFFDELPLDLSEEHQHASSVQLDALEERRSSGRVQCRKDDERPICQPKYYPPNPCSGTAKCYD